MEIEARQLFCREVAEGLTRKTLHQWRSEPTGESGNVAVLHGPDLMRIAVTADQAFRTVAAKLIDPAPQQMPRWAMPDRGRHRTKAQAGRGPQGLVNSINRWLLTPENRRWHRWMVEHARKYEQEKDQIEQAREAMRTALTEHGVDIGEHRIMGRPGQVITVGHLDMHVEGGDRVHLKMTHPMEVNAATALAVALALGGAAHSTDGKSGPLGNGQCDDSNGGSAVAAQ